MTFWKSTIGKLRNSYKYKEHDYYKSLDFVTIFSFFMVVSTDDYRYLLKIKDYENLPQNIDNKILESAWNKIYNDFTDAEDSNSSIIHFTTSKSVHKMELEYHMLSNLYHMMAIAPNHELTKETILYVGEGDDIKLIQKRLKSLKNKINLKRKDIEKQTDVDEKINVWDIITQMGIHIGQDIDVKNKTMRDYMSIRRTIKKNSKHKKEKA